MQACKAGLFFAVTQLEDPLFHRLRSIFIMARVDSQGATVGRNFFDIEDRESVGEKNLLDRSKGQVGKMLVVNRVELIFVHEPHQMRELHGNHSRALQQHLQACDKVVDVGYMCEDIISEQQIGLFSLRDKLTGGFYTEEFNERRNSFALRHCSNIGSGLNTKNRNTPLNKVLEEVSIIACDLHYVTF